MNELTIEARGTYAQRTKQNAALADITIAFAINFATAGELLTARAAGAAYLQVNPRDGVHAAFFTIYERLEKMPSRILNIAGNSACTLRGSMTQNEADEFVYSVLRRVHKEIPIEMIRSGGQTGFDEAGIKAAVMLRIPAHALLPHGYLIRTVDCRDVHQTEAQARARLSDISGLL